MGLREIFKRFARKNFSWLEYMNVRSAGKAKS